MICCQTPFARVLASPLELVCEMRECLVRSCNALGMFFSCHGAAHLDVAHVVAQEESISTIKGVNI